MNERIKQLAEQAISFRLDPDSKCYEALIQSILIHPEDLELFAELIVQECVNWIDGSPTTEEGTLILSKSFIIANLKQHFGVEE